MQSIIAIDEAISTVFVQTIAASPVLSNIFIVLGVGLVYLLPLILLYTWFVLSRKTALRSALVGIIAWEGLNKMVATYVARPRPAFSQIGTKELIFHRPDTSFPSDHSAFLMAVAATFYFTGHKKLGHLTLGIAVLVGIARVGIGVHFPTDILAGWLIGFIVAYLFNLIEKPVDDYIIEPSIKFAQRFHL